MGGGRGRRRGGRGGGVEEVSRRVFVLATVMMCIRSACGICVIDNKKGWHIQCGVRDSYLFRLKDYGGVNANFDFSFGLGDEVGFPLSIKNTKGHHHYRRKDSTARNSKEAERREGKGGAGFQGGGGKGTWPHPSSVLNPPPPHQASQRSSSGPPSPESTVANTPSPVNHDGSSGSSVPSPGGETVPLSAKGDTFVGIPYVRTPARRRSSRRRSSTTSSLSSFFSSLVSWLPWPFGEASWFSSSSSSSTTPSRADSRNSHFRVIQDQFGNDLSLPHHQAFPQSFPPQHQSFSPHQPFRRPFSPFSPPSFGPPPFGIPPFPFPRPPGPRPSQRTPPRTIGPAVADVLKVSPDTPADTDHVPSFAAKVFVVREAPKDFYPPGYTPDPDQRQPPTVEVPRTKFFCEEQRYLPGLYADTQLGCKVFHMCLPAAVGNTQTSFLCPNMTLFDQSILSCNWWYYVRCEDSAKSFDANLPLALSYRKVNAAQLPLAAITDYNSLSLLDISARTARNLDEEDGGVGRMGLADGREEKGDGKEEKGDRKGIVEDKDKRDGNDHSANKDGDDPKPSLNDNTEDVKTDERILNVNKPQEEEGKDKTKDDTEAKANTRLSINKLQEEEEHEKMEDIKTDTGQSRKKRRKRSNLDTILYLPTRRHNSVILSRLQRRKDTLP